MKQPEQRCHTRGQVTSYRLVSCHRQFTVSPIPPSISHRCALSLRHVSIPSGYLVCLGYRFPTQLLDRPFFLLRLALPLLLFQPLHLLILTFHYLVKLLPLLGALLRAEEEGHGHARNDAILVNYERGRVRCPVCLGFRHRMQWMRLPWFAHRQPFFCLACFQSCIYPERKSDRLRQLCHRQRGTLRIREKEGGTAWSRPRHVKRSIITVQSAHLAPLSR